MRVLCVGRHRFLSEHFCRFFEAFGVDTVPCVGLHEAMTKGPQLDIDAVICDYDLLATMPLVAWEQTPTLAEIPLVAVSMTRQPGEAHLQDINGIAGFLYLPTLEPEDAQRVLAAIRRRRGGGINPPNVLPWTSATPVAPAR